MYSDSFPSWLTYLADLRYCKRLLSQGSRSFTAASLLLPSVYRQPITALYAFCRESDDIIDRTGADSVSLEQLHERLDRIYAGRPGNDPVDRSFTDVVMQYGIPQAIPLALLEGFTWDIRNRRYETLADTSAYSARVAGTVGTMMAMIMGVTSRPILSRACDLGLAMQLTNIARDVGEDARNGRIYLPLDRMRAHGIDPDAWLANPEFTPEVGAVVKELLDTADDLYRRAEFGLAQLPSSCRPSMFAARYIYAEIGAVVEQNGYDSVNTRAIVTGSRKLVLLGKAVRAAAGTIEEDDAPTVEEARFLLDAIPSG